LLPQKFAMLPVDWIFLVAAQAQWPCGKLTAKFPR